MPGCLTAAFKIILRHFRLISESTLNEKIRARGGEEMKCAEGHKASSDQFVVSEWCLLPISLNEVKVCCRGGRGRAHTATSI